MGYFKELDIERKDALRLAQPDCCECGGIGYLVVVTNGKENMNTCFRCWLNALDTDEEAQNG